MDDASSGRVWRGGALHRKCRTPGRQAAGAADHETDSYVAKVPGAGGYLPEDSSQIYRQLIEGNYRIIYRYEKGVVIIASIYHAARHLRSDELP